MEATVGVAPLTGSGAFQHIIDQPRSPGQFLECEWSW